jgi:hypothetical protein
MPELDDRAAQASSVGLAGSRATLGVVTPMVTPAAGDSARVQPIVASQTRR